MKRKRKEKKKGGSPSCFLITSDKECIKAAPVV